MGAALTTTATPTLRGAPLVRLGEGVRGSFQFGADAEAQTLLLVPFWLLLAPPGILLAACSGWLLSTGGLLVADGWLFG